MEVVAQAWNKPMKYNRQSNAATRIGQKLKAVRYALKKWSKKISRLNIAIENTNKTLLELDNIEDRRPLTTPERNFRNILKKHLLRLLQHQKDYWKKRCTIRWIQFGDENSKKIQTVATERYRRNYISSLKIVDRSVVEDNAGKESVR